MKGYSTLPMTPDEAYEKALRRIRKAEETGAVELDLRGWIETSGELTGLEILNRLPRELARLTKLQSLNLSFCMELSDLSPLASLSSLVLYGCTQLSDLSPLAGLISLRTLILDDCGVRRFAPLEFLLPTLNELSMSGCKLEDLPHEVCGEETCQNVLNKVRAHYEDLKAGQQIDAEVKVLFLGNGGAGKTQLCRRLRDLPFDPSIPSTHGVELAQTTVELDGFLNLVRLNLWDFGGQDTYHGLRNKPASAPAFPGTRTPQTPGVSPTQPAYPGAAETTSTSIAEMLSTVAGNADQTRRLSAAQRLQFMR